MKFRHVLLECYSTVDLDVSINGALFEIVEHIIPGLDFSVFSSQWDSASLPSSRLTPKSKRASDVSLDDGWEARAVAAVALDH